MRAEANLKVTSYIVLAVAVAANAWFEQYARGSSARITLDGMSAWVAAPFLLLLVAVFLAASARTVKVVLASSAMLALFGISFYWDAMFLHVDAQVGLIFLFVPFYQLVAVAIILIGVIFVRVRMHLRPRSG
jgi:hypothetical protein